MMAALLTSCHDGKELPDGAWDPIEMDRSTLYFPKTGGCDTIRLLNYSGWWLTGADARLNDTTIHYYPKDESEYHAIKGKWFTITIPEEDRKLLIIKISEASTDDYLRELNIGLECGDAFSSARVTQHCY